MTSVELSVVIPAYNEAAVIRQPLESVSSYLTTGKVSHEIIVVDDRSTDDAMSSVGGTTHVHLIQDTWRSLTELVQIRTRGLRNDSLRGGG